MIPSRSEVIINGVNYRLWMGTERPFREYAEPAIVQQGTIAGSSRPAQQARPDNLTWRIDDWSLGEGQKYFDTRPDAIDDSARKYYTSTDGVDVSIPGQISLARAFSVSKTQGSKPTTGPYIVDAGTIWLFSDVSANELTSVAATPSGDTWTARTTGLTANIKGPPAAVDASIYAATANEIERITSTTQEQYVATGGQGPVAANNRLYYTVSVTAGAEIRRVDLYNATLPQTPTTLYTTLRGSAGHLAAVGPRIFAFSPNSSTSNTNRLHVLDADVGREFAVLDGFVTGNTSISKPLGARDGILFFGGAASNAAGVNKGIIYYVVGDTINSFGPIRDDDSSTTTVSAVGRGRVGEMLFGTTSGRIFRYDLRLGGLSLIGIEPNGDRITTCLFSDGNYYFASTGNGANVGRVYRTQTSGSGKYLSTSTVSCSTWDFNLPEETKILKSITLHTEQLPANTSVSVQVVLDGTSVTTDSSGATMTYSTTGGTKKTWLLSNSSTERSFRYAQPKIVLSTSDTSATPAVLGVTLKAETTGVERFFDVWVDCTDPPARVNGDGSTGRQKVQNIRDLISNAEANSTASKLFTFQAKIYDPVRRPGVAGTHTVSLERGELVYFSKAEPVAFLRLKRYIEA